MFTWGESLTLRYFEQREFDHPELMDPDFLTSLDELRHRCGFPLKVNDDARTMSELRAIYKHEIQNGLSWPKDSAHLVTAGMALCRAVDIKPSLSYSGVMSYEVREMRLVHHILDMHFNGGYWMYLGLIIETAHIHLDDVERLKGKRPYLGVGVSR